MHGAGDVCGRCCLVVLMSVACAVSCAALVFVMHCDSRCSYFYVFVEFGGSSVSSQPLRFAWPLFSASLVMASLAVDGGLSFAAAPQRASARPEECAAWFARLMPDAPVPSPDMTLVELSAFSDALQSKRNCLENELRRVGWVQTWILRFCRKAHGRDLAAFLAQGADVGLVGGDLDLAEPSPAAGGGVALAEDSLAAGPAAAEVSSVAGPVTGAVLPVAAGAADSPQSAASGEPVAGTLPVPRPPAAAVRAAASPRASPAASSASRSRSRGAATSRAGAAGGAGGDAGAGAASLPKTCPRNRCQRCHNIDRKVSPSFPHTHGADGRVCDSTRPCTSRQPASRLSAAVGALAVGSTASSGSGSGRVAASARARSSSSSGLGSDSE